MEKKETLEAEERSIVFTKTYFPLLPDKAGHSILPTLFLPAPPTASVAQCLSSDPQMWAEVTGVPPEQKGCGMNVFSHMLSLQLIGPRRESSKAPHEDCLVRITCMEGWGGVSDANEMQMFC